MTFSSNVSDYPLQMPKYNFCKITQQQTFIQYNFEMSVVLITKSKKLHRHFFICRRKTGLGL
jgi:hypothetical protein